MSIFHYLFNRLEYNRTGKDHRNVFSDIFDLFLDLVHDERMKSFGCDEIDNESESVRNEVFQVRTCHQTDWLVEFNNNVDITLFCLFSF